MLVRSSSVGDPNEAAHKLAKDSCSSHSVISTWLQFHMGVSILNFLEGL
jgi:hypothetical protein